MREFTEEEIKLIAKVWDEQRDEFKAWADQHGVMHMESWLRERPNAGYFDPDLAYYMLTKFVEWKQLINRHKRTNSIQ
jgi:hypothetical protein